MPSGHLQLLPVRNLVGGMGIEKGGSGAVVEGVAVDLKPDLTAALLRGGKAWPPSPRYANGDGSGRRTAPLLASFGFLGGCSEDNGVKV